jgi:D-sedoheptulose 7-phosphate isomerase
MFSIVGFQSQAKKMAYSTCLSVSRPILGRNEPPPQGKLGNMNTHLGDLVARYPQLDECQQSIAKAFDALCECYAHDAQLLLAGNGGSAADCEHWAGELLKSFRRGRPIPGDWRQWLGPDLAPKLQGGLSAIPLVGFPSFRSAFDNDVDPKFSMAQLVWVLGRENDVLAAISTSGDSENVIFAARVARAKAIKVIALTGAGGGRLAENADIVIAVPERETHKVQELHLPVYHTLSMMLEDEFFG